MTDALAGAEAVVDAASARAAVEIRALATLEELRKAEALLTDVWGRPPASPTLETDLLRAFVLSGNYVAGAWRGAGLVAVAVAIHGRGPDGVYLYSVVTGVRQPDQVRHVGFALKQHQRAWALARDIDLVTWTFDPLVRRNAWFNLTKLGAEVTGYHDNLYGPMDDAFNRGDETDRCLVAWRLRGPRAVAAAAGAVEPAQPERAVRILAPRPDGTPECAAPAGGGPLLAWVPDDITAVRTRDPANARAWRLAARETLGRAIEAGYTATAMLRSGSYVLERRP